MKKIPRLLFLLSFVLLASCSENADEWYDYSTNKDAIRGGISADDAAYAPVVSIAVRANDVLYSYCTGVLIAHDAVLTAAHCLKNEAGFPFESFYRSGQIVVATGNKIATVLDTKFYEIEDFYVHPKNSDNHHDLAIIRLKTEIPDVEPISLYSDKSRLKGFAYYGQTVEFVGYGYDENKSDGVRLKSSGKVEQYCAWADKNDCGKTLNSGDYLVVPGGSFVHEISESGPCQGDSGGPVIVQNNGVNQVVGIVSFGDSDCSMYSVSMSVPDHLDWIQETLFGSPDEDGCAAMPLKRKHPFSICLIIFMVLTVLGYNLRRWFVRFKGE